MQLDMSSYSKYYTIRVLYIATFIETTNDSLKNTFRVFICRFMTKTSEKPHKITLIVYFE